MCKNIHVYLYVCVYIYSDCACVWECAIVRVWPFLACQALKKLAHERTHVTGVVAVVRRMHRRCLHQQLACAAQMPYCSNCLLACVCVCVCINACVCVCYICGCLFVCVWCARVLAACWCCVDSYCSHCLLACQRIHECLCLLCIQIGLCVRVVCMCVCNLLALCRWPTVRTACLPVNVCVCMCAICGWECVRV